MSSTLFIDWNGTKLAGDLSGIDRHLLMFPLLLLENGRHSFDGDLADGDLLRNQIVYKYLDDFGRSGQIGTKLQTNEAPFCL